MSQPSHNPYAPPEHEEPAIASRPSELAVASAGTRFVHLLVDFIVSMVLVFVIAFVSVLLQLDTQLPVWFVAFGYHFIFEATLGRTPAKYLTGTRVVTLDGQRPSAWQILGRSLVRYVPFEPFSFMSDQGIGWHDRWSGTRVVKIRQE